MSPFLPRYVNFIFIFIDIFLSMLSLCDTPCLFHNSSGMFVQINAVKALGFSIFLCRLEEIEGYLSLATWVNQQLAFGHQANIQSCLFMACNLSDYL